MFNVWQSTTEFVINNWPWIVLAWFLFVAALAFYFWWLEGQLIHLRGTCDYCSKWLPTITYGGRGARYCSTDCQQKGNSDGSM